jgi:hypothetical protein
MLRKVGAILALVVFVSGSSATAQATGTTAFSAPYRAFDQHEFGGTLSFPDDGGGIAAEGLYGFGSGKFDIGLRGGVWDPSAGDAIFLAGVNVRQRVIDHSEQFPLDGAIVFGLGAQFIEDATTLIIPFGLSMGRRLDVEDSEVSIVPYVQPTAFLTEGQNQDLELNFSLGIGGDFRLSRMFDARVGVGLGDMQGISISAVWLR